MPDGPTKRAPPTGPDDATANAPRTSDSPACSVVAAPAEALPQGFGPWMAELDAMQALRARDPASALARVVRLRHRWSGMTPAQDALLRARCALQVAAAQLVLGDHAATAEESARLDGLLRQRALRVADPDIQRQAQRCRIAAGNVKAVLAHGLGDYAGALRAYLDALDTARALGDRHYEAHLLVNLANTFEESGLPGESLEHSRMALDIAQALDMSELVGDIHHNIGNALAACGEHEQGLASNRRALDAYAALGSAQKESYALVAMAERLLELGRPVDAARALRQRAARALSFVNLQYEAYAAYLDGRIAIALADGARARSAFAHALEITAGPLADRVGQARAHIRLAGLDLADGQHASAAERAGLALALLDGGLAQRDLMQCHELLGAIAKARGDFAAALHHHELFHAGYTRCFNDESARKARLLAVRHEVDLARADAQREHLENARLTEALAEIGARLQRRDAVAGAALARDAVAAPAPTGGTLPARPEDLRGLGLTPREAEVLFWVTQGKTNEDVTVILGAGMSVVKKHLGRIYEKLGVENRTAAAAAVRRRTPGG